MPIVSVPIHTLVLDEQHLAAPATELERADDPIVHDRTDVAVLPRIGRQGGIEETFLLITRDPIANSLGFLIQPNTESMETKTSR